MATDEDDGATKRPVGRPSLYATEYCEQVEAFMATGFSLTAFAGEIGVCIATLKTWQKEYPEFLAAVSRAKAKRLLEWEKIGLNIAKVGGGTGSATMAVFGLKNMGGDEWADKVVNEHGGIGGGPIQSVSMTPEQFEEAARKIAGEV